MTPDSLEANYDEVKEEKKEEEGNTTTEHRLNMTNKYPQVLYIQPQNTPIVKRFFPVITVSLLITTCTLWLCSKRLGTHPLRLISPIGLIYLICIDLYSPRGISKMNIGSELSPNFHSWRMYTITPYPSCQDVRGEAWRLLSNQFVHQGIPHIAGNSVALFFFGGLLEIYHPLNSLIILIVFEASMIIGNLAYSYFFPYDGIVGNSPGVYGLLGACVILVLFLRDRLDPIVQFTAPAAITVFIVLDVTLYFLLYSATTGYIAHWFGFLTGLSIAMISLLVCHPLQKTREANTGCCNRSHRRIFVAGLGGALLVLMTSFLLSQYLSGKSPPQPFVNSTYLKNRQPSCCEQLLRAIDRYSPPYSEQTIREYSYCDDTTQQLYIQINLSAI